MLGIQNVPVDNYHLPGKWEQSMRTNKYSVFSTSLILNSKEGEEEGEERLGEGKQAISFLSKSLLS